MAPFRSIASGSRRAVQHALAALGLALTLGVGLAATPAPADAAPAATATLAARPAAKKAGKSGKTVKRAKAGTRARTAAKASRRKASKTSARARRAARSVRSAPTATPTPQASADLVSVPTVVLPDLAIAAAPAGAPATEGALTLITRSATSLLDGLLARARSQLGTRYVYGGADPDSALDCSSFARYVMEALNVRLPRTAHQQARVGTAVPRDLAALRPGDLLTFGSPRRTSHVGIYLGAGRFIHASVKSGQVIETTIDRNRSLFRRWQGARRLLAGAPESAADSAAQGGDGTSGG